MANNRESLGFPGGSVSKESACNVGNLGLIPGAGRSPGGGMASHSSILAWRIPRTVEPGRLQSMGSQSQAHPGSHYSLIHLNSCNGSKNGEVTV